jgi:hypothetical protein
MKVALITLLGYLRAISAWAAAPYKHSPTTKYPSYDGLIMAGYQGWFRAEGDGTNSRFSHYFASEGNCGIDAWPDVSEYERTYPTPFRLADGSSARLFSLHDKSTVNLHFKRVLKHKRLPFRLASSILAHRKSKEK